LSCKPLPKQTHHLQCIRSNPGIFLIWQSTVAQSPLPRRAIARNLVRRQYLQSRRLRHCKKSLSMRLAIALTCLNPIHSILLLSIWLAILIIQFPAIWKSVNGLNHSMKLFRFRVQSLRNAIKDFATAEVPSPFWDVCHNFPSWETLAFMAGGGSQDEPILLDTGCSQHSLSDITLFGDALQMFLPHEKTRTIRGIGNTIFRPSAIGTAGCDDSTPVRGASYEPVVLLGVSAEPRLSPRRQREEIFHCFDASRSASCGHRGLFSTSKHTTTACLPT
jgi:hypothetical protein